MATNNNDNNDNTTNTTTTTMTVEEGRRFLRRGDDFCWNAHYEDALASFQQAKLIFRARRGPLSLELASAYLGSGISYYAQHSYDEAVKEIKKSIRILKWRPFSRFSLKMASNYHFMALCKDETKQYDKAIVYFKRAIHIQQVLVPQSLKLACSYHDYGLALRHRNNKGDYTRALKVTRRAVDIREAVAPSTLSLAATYDNLAYIHREQQEPEQEILYSLKSIEIRESQNSTCPILSLRYTNLGAAYHNKGNYIQAAEYAEKAIQIQQLEDYPESLQNCLALSIHNLGAAYYGMGKYRAAIFQFQKDVAMRERLGLDLIGESYYCLGNAFHRRTMYQRAIECHLHAIQVYNKEEPDSPELANVHLALGITYTAVRQTNKALDSMYTAQDIQERKAPNSSDLARTYHALGTVMHDGGNYKNAIYYMNKACTVRESFLEKPNLLDLSRTIYILATSHESLGDYSKAVYYYSKSLETRQKSGVKGFMQIYHALGVATAKLAALGQEQQQRQLS